MMEVDTMKISESFLQKNIGSKMVITKEPENLPQTGFITLHSER